MTADQLQHFSDLIAVIGAVVVFGLGYLGGYSQ